MPGWWRRKRLNHWFETSSRVLVFGEIPGAGIMTDHEKWHIFKARFVWKFCSQLKRPINQWGPSFIGQTLLGSMMQWLFQDQQPSWLRNIKIFDHKAQQGDTHWASYIASCFFFWPGVVSSFQRKLMGWLKLLLTVQFQSNYVKSVEESNAYTCLIISCWFYQLFHVLYDAATTCLCQARWCLQCFPGPLTILQSHQWHGDIPRKYGLLNSMEQ